MHFAQRESIRIRLIFKPEEKDKRKSASSAYRLQPPPGARTARDKSPSLGRGWGGARIVKRRSRSYGRSGCKAFGQRIHAARSHPGKGKSHAECNRIICCISLGASSRSAHRARQKVPRKAGDLGGGYNLYNGAAVATANRLIRRRSNVYTIRSTERSPPKHRQTCKTPGQHIRSTKQRKVSSLYEIRLLRYLLLYDIGFHGYPRDTRRRV